MDKQQIIAQIKRIADANGGIPPGVRLFRRETGITQSDLFPHLWLRWSDALKEAGYSPREKTRRISDESLLQTYIAFVRELGHFPISGEMRLKSARDKTFPTGKTFDRFGGKEKLIDAVGTYCRDKPEYQDIVALCDASKRPAVSDNEANDKTKIAIGCVYLRKTGRHYRIGRTNSVSRRGRELAIIIPYPMKVIHIIETDDPSGVETYWQNRFDDKKIKGHGDWFNLSPEDVRAFKRWKRIV